MRIPRKEPQKARIEIIPMIDVIFFLLVFFMVSTLSMTINRGLPVNLPTAATSQKAMRENLTTYCTALASLSKGFFALEPRVSSAEREALARVIHELTEPDSEVVKKILEN